MKSSFADILQEIDTERQKKISAKLPEWSQFENLNIPSDLALEQCSSTATALYKAGIIKDYANATSHLGALKVADITGGLGVDSWAFCSVADKVFYNELNTKLSKAAADNFKAMGITNIHISNTDALRSLVPLGRLDWIYLDPSRRDPSGKKVFLLEDCEPDILNIKDELFKCCPRIMVKVSPMADISMLAERFGPCLSQIHIVGLQSECKELICILEKGNKDPYRIVVADLPNPTFTFAPSEVSSSKEVLLQNKESLVGQSIVVPGAAVTKANCASILCERFGWKKLGKFTQIFVREEGETLIAEILPFNNANIKMLSKAYPHCELTARNIPITTEELRKKMGVSSGDDAHIYACTCDFTDSPSEKLLIVSKKRS